MADNKKNKGTDSQTFRREPDGTLSPVFPPVEPNLPEGTSPSLSRLEPVFTLDLEKPLEPEPMDSEAAVSSAAAPPPSPISPTPPPSNPQEENERIQSELSNLQPQVDTIARTPSSEGVSSDQLELLRKYIALKESESRDLKEQQRQYQAYVRKLTGQVQTLTHKTQDLLSELETAKRQEESSRLEAREIEKRFREENLRQKNEYEDQLRKTGNVSSEYQELQRRREEWKDKVREDLKRIKLKERELENKYELLKRDTQALLDSKDKHVIELKRKNDALELEMEALEERLRNATLSVSAVEAKKRRLIETLKLAISLLEQVDRADLPETKREAG